MGCCLGKSFDGEGHRLGSATATTNTSRTPNNNHHHDLQHQPAYDPSLDDVTRDQRRKEREAAAKARMEKNGGTKKKKQSAKISSQPLRGPNSRNTMTWTMGS